MKGVNGLGGRDRRGTFVESLEPVKMRETQFRPVGLPRCWEVGMAASGGGTVRRRTVENGVPNDAQGCDTHLCWEEEGCPLCFLMVGQAPLYIHSVESRH